MKLNNLFENPTLSSDQISWLTKYIDAFNNESAARSAIKEFYIANGKIETFRNFLFIENYYQDEDPLPEQVRFGHIPIMSFIDCQLENFDMLPSSAKSVTFRSSTEILPRSLKGISKTLKRCHQIEISSSVESGLLEAFKIEDMTKFVYNWGPNKTRQKPIEEAISIVNEYLKEGWDIFDCQDKLMDLNLGRFC